MPSRTVRLRKRATYLYLLVFLASTLWILTWLGRGPFAVPVIRLDYGLVKPTSPTSQYAITTFLSASDTTAVDPSAPDTYYDSVRVLAYQLLHDSDTRLRTPRISFIVLTTAEVHPTKIARLKRDGATILPAEAVRLPWWVKTGVTRWKDQFTKLRLLQQTQFDRILFLDADTFLTGPLDTIFQSLSPTFDPAPTNFSRRSQLRADEAPLPASYVFAARSDNALTGERDHPFPPLRTPVFSAGFWLAAPSQELFEYAMSVTRHWRRFDPHTMEQSLLNYVFRREGAMPWAELDYRWSATWPNERDWEEGVVTLHEKAARQYGPKSLVRAWQDKWKEMLAFYAKKEEQET